MDQTELRRIEAQCIQEEPPRCTAACPLHVDAREVCKLVAAGNTDKAWGILCRTLPLPGLLARICTAPCKDACLRGKVGGAIEMAGIERFCAENASRTPKVRALPSRGKNVAVLGANLAGLCASWDLARKGFSVTLFCASADQAFKWLKASPYAKSLSPEIFQREIDALARLGIIFKANSAMDAALAKTCLNDFDAVFADPQCLTADALGVESPDALTLQTSVSNLFAAPETREASPVHLAAIGRKAALSIERTLQGASLTAGREREDPFKTRLYTNLSGTVSISPVPLTEDGYSTDHATAEARRCLQCECMECVKSCAYLKEFGSYPKVYARQVYNNASIVMGTRQANTLINSCMLCGLCTEICPENFSMTDLCRDARQDMVQRDKMPPSAHEFALRDMAFASSSACTICRHQPGTDESAYVFFPGCQLPASSPHGVESVYAHLCENLEGGVGLYLTCCGAPADWAGQNDLFHDQMLRLTRDWESLGRPTIITACPSCSQTLAKALPNTEILSLWSLLRRSLSALHPALPDGILSLHDPCTARHDETLLSDVRALLAEIGVRAGEPDLSGTLTECCGFGGLLTDANQPLAATVAAKRVETLGADGITYCSMCRDLLAKGGGRCLHFLDVLFPAEGTASAPVPRPAPTYSERRENRVRLKERLQETLWDAESAPRPEYESISVTFTDEAAGKMDARRIMKTDVQKVLLQAHGTNRELVHSDTGHFLASHRPANVTYWVEYSKEERGGYRIHNVWSHRMRILGGAS